MIFTGISFHEGDGIAGMEKGKEGLGREDGNGEVEERNEFNSRRSDLTLLQMTFYSGNSFFLLLSSSSFSFFCSPPFLWRAWRYLTGPPEMQFLLFNG